MAFDPNDELKRALEAHGMEARLEEGWLALPGSSAVLRGRHYAMAHHPGAVVARLDVQVGLPDGRLLVESHGAPGKDVDQAGVQCLAKFLMGSLHPILGAFFGHREHQELDEWSIRGAAFEAFLGPVVAQSVEKEPPSPAMIAPVLKELTGTRQGVSRRPHWIRIFFARSGDETTFEALWDNEPWPEMVEAMKKLEWPKLDSYYSMRQFLVLSPVTPEPATERGYRAYERAVTLLVEACAKDRGLNDDAAFEKLVASGVEAAVAEDTIQFGPLGFTEVLFQRCKLAATYQMIDANNDVVAEKPLASEPSFVAAREVASALREQEDGKDRFMAVASRCSRFSAANQALAKGSKL